MKAAAFDYVAPRTLAEAAAALAEAREEGRQLAAGQSLGPMLNLRLARPGLLIDITRIAALKRIEDRGDRVLIGATVTHAALEDRRFSFAGHDRLAEVARGIAYRAVRNRGTIGGSIAHADPAADWLTVLTALGAELAIAGPAGRPGAGDRRALAGFVRGAFQTALAPGEIVEGVLLPKLPAATRWGYYKLCRKPGEYADAMCAVVFDPERRQCRVIAGATSGAPAALDDLAERLAVEGAAAATPARAAAAIAAALPGLDAIDARLHAVAVERAARQAFAPQEAAAA